jgi:hypothetical protein
MTMNKIIAPLRLQMQGPTVADLQDALQWLLDRRIIFANDESSRWNLSEALKRERVEQTYGADTSRLVGLFQESRRLQPTGEVDEATTIALNGVLEELGAFRPTASDERFVAGQVSHEDGRPLANAVVRAFHVGDPVMLRLGEDATDGDGRYTIRYAPVAGVDAVRLLATVVDSSGKALANAEVPTPVKPIEVMNLTVADRRTYQVFGKVLSPASASVSELQVRMVDKGVGDLSDAQLASAVTDADGAYQASFDDGVLQQRKKTGFDLQARLFSGVTFLGASEVRYDPPATVPLDVILPEKTTVSLRVSLFRGRRNADRRSSYRSAVVGEAG